MLIATDIHIHQIDGKWYLAKQIYHIIKRYHDYFGEIVLFCREDNSPTKEELLSVDKIISGHICFSSLSSVLIGKDKNRLEMAIKQSDLVIGRFHAFSACVAARLAKRKHKPFLAEVMGDAWDGYWNHGLMGKIVAPFVFLETIAIQ